MVEKSHRFTQRAMLTPEEVFLTIGALERAIYASYPRDMSTQPSKQEDNSGRWHVHIHSIYISNCADAEDTNTPPSAKKSC